MSLQMEDVATQIMKLSPKHGDVLVVRANPMTAPEQLEALADQISHVLDDNGVTVSVLVTQHDFDITVLNQEQMAAMGWQRIPTGWGDRARRKG